MTVASGYNRPKALWLAAMGLFPHLRGRGTDSQLSVGRFNRVYTGSVR